MGNKMDKVIFPTSDYIEINPPTKSLCGSIASFSDGGNAPISSLTANIEPVQDLHGYDSPWVGGAGKNKFDVDNISEIQTTAEGRRNGQVYEGVGTFTVSASANTLSGSYIYSRTYKNGVYSSADTIATDSVHSSKTYTLAEGDKLIVFDASMHTIAESKQVFVPAKVMIESGSTATTFAPYSNICPISGWDVAVVTRCGANVWDEEWEIGGISTLTGQNESANDIIRSKNYISVIPNKTYHIVGDSKVYCLYLYDRNKNYITNVLVSSYQNANILVRSDCYYIRFRCFASYGTTYNNDISVNYPSTDTEYHAYNGTTYTTALKDANDQPIECYGGELANENGVQTLNKTHGAIVDMGALTWTYDNRFSGFRTSLTGYKKSTSSAPNALCEIAKGYSTNAFLANTSVIGFSFGVVGGYDNNILLRLDGVTTSGALTPLITGKKLIFEFETPQTIPQQSQAISTQDGTNNIWADTGDVCVTYVTQEYQDLTVNFAATASKLGSSNIGSATQPIYLNGGTATACTYTLGKSVPSDAVFTDTDTKVTQTETSTNANYEVLFSGTASTATTTEGNLKSSGLRFNPSKKAIMEGIVTTASGNNSHAEGQATYASTTCAHAEGVATSATGQYSHAEGATCIASGTYSHAEGSGSRATYDCAHAEGMGTTANGGCSHAEGSYTLASNGQDHAEGYKTTANGGYSHAEGTYTQATAAGAHAEGYATSAKPHIASGLGAHVEGYGTTAYCNTASGVGSHAEGYGTIASGQYSHAEGYKTTASYNFSHAEGGSSIASGICSHAEGSNTTASSTYSHAEGFNTEASGKQSHAEGFGSKASGIVSHAEGYRTAASGLYSHAEGNATIASGSYSHAEGFQTTANHESQHVFGEYNLADASTAAATARGDYVEIVGNGLSSTQLSNARTLDWSGNEWLAGSLVASSVSAVDSNSNTNTSISPTGLATYTVPSGSQAISTGLYTTSDDIVLYSGTVTNTWDGTNSSLKTAIAGKLSKAGGTMTGAITTETGKWYTEGNYTLHLNNSDMIGVNGIWFSDVSSDAGEGLMFLRSNGNWDDLYSVDGNLYYCTNRATAEARGSAYTILHTGNGVLSNGGKYTGGNKTAGYCMHGVGTGHTYAVEWGSNLGFWVDVTKVATVSDRRLKDDIEPINMDLVKAIAECPSYQYKAFNRNGLISTGIIAQDLVENCKKYNVDPLKYELLDMEEFIDGDPTLYYHIEYDQLLYFKTLYLENKIKELEEKLCNLHKD